MGYINLTDVEKQEVFSLKKALLEDQINFSDNQAYVPACMLRSFNVDLTISNQGLSSALNIESPTQTVHYRIEDPEIHVFYYHVPSLVKQQLFEEAQAMGGFQWFMQSVENSATKPLTSAYDEQFTV